MLEMTIEDALLYNALGYDVILSAGEVEIRKEAQHEG